MDITMNDMDWRSILIKKYKNYDLNEEDCMVLLVSDCILHIEEKTLITKEILSPYMSNIDMIDASLSNLMTKKYMVIRNEGSSFYSSIDDFKKRLFEDAIKDLTLKNSLPVNSDSSTSGLYQDIEKIAGRSLSALERDQVSSWLKSGAEPGMIKEALTRSLTKSGNVSFRNADKLILEMQRSESRKSIGASMVNEETRKREELRDLFANTDWTYHGDK
jgi:DNA replication protein DnaD